MSVGMLREMGKADMEMEGEVKREWEGIWKGRGSYKGIEEGMVKGRGIERGREGKEKAKRNYGP